MPRSKPSNAGNSESRRTNVLLEAIRKEVRVIAENHLSLRADIDSMKTETMLLHVLHSEFQTFKGALLEMSGDMKILKGDVATLKTDVNTLKGDVAQLKTDVNTLKGDVAELKTDVKDIKDRLTLVEAK